MEAYLRAYVHMHMYMRALLIAPCVSRSEKQKHFSLSLALSLSLSLAPARSLYPMYVYIRCVCVCVSVIVYMCFFHSAPGTDGICDLRGERVCDTCAHAHPFLTSPCPTFQKALYVWPVISCPAQAMVSCVF